MRYLQRNDIHNFAEKIKAKFYTNDAYEIAESAGLLVRQFDLGELKGAYKIINRNRIIMVNSNLDEKMQEIVVLHETGHDFLHRHLAASGQFQEFSFYDMTSKPEMEANIFAANIKLTDNEVEDYFRDGYTTEQTAKLLCVPHQLLLIKLTDMNNRGYDFNLDYIPRGDFLGS